MLNLRPVNTDAFFQDSRIDNGYMQDTFPTSGRLHELKLGNHSAWRTRNPVLQLFDLEAPKVRASIITFPR